MIHSLRQSLAIFGLLVFLVLQTACNTMPALPGMPKPPGAGATLAPVFSASVRGLVKFTDDGKGMVVVADFSGLLPGTYTLHLQETAECATMAAYRADGMKTYDKVALGGMMLAVTADVYGTARSETLLSGLSLEGKDSIIGRTVVLFAIAADGRPIRMACGTVAPL